MVWLSDHIYATRCQIKFSPHAEESIVPYIKANADEVSDVYGSIKHGRCPVRQDLVPKRLILEAGRRTLPDIFRANALPIVSAKLHDLLLQFNLGATHFYECSIERKNGEPIPGPWFIINDTETKDALVPKRSKLKPLHVGYRAIGGIAVSGAAVHGVDVWRDPELFESVFFSDALVTAFKKEKISGLKLARVLVVEDSRDQDFQEDADG